MTPSGGVLGSKDFADPGLDVNEIQVKYVLQGRNLRYISKMGK